MLRLNKPRSIVLLLVVMVAVVSVGYIGALAILAPKQLAEATTAATDLICDGCVGNTDIAGNAVTSGKIGNGQVHNADIGGNAVTTSKIADGQVFSSDIGDLTIVSSDIADNAITSSKMSGGAVKPNMQKVQGSLVTISPHTIIDATANCPPGFSITGGGFTVSNFDVIVARSAQGAGEFWRVTAMNPSGSDRSVTAYAVCMGPSP